MNLYNCLYSLESIGNGTDMFFHSKVQDLLKKLTRIDINVVFRKHMNEETMADPTYKFMTTDQVQQVRILKSFRRNVFQLNFYIEHDKFSNVSRT